MALRFSPVAYLPTDPAYDNLIHRITEPDDLMLERTARCGETGVFFGVTPEAEAGYGNTTRCPVCYTDTAPRSAPEKEEVHSHDTGGAA